MPTVKVSAPYTSKIIKAGALLTDTRLLLAHWKTSADERSNLRRIQEENLFAKASRSRVRDILAIFRQRYLGDPALLAALAALVALARGEVAASVLDPILYFQAIQADALLRDVIKQVLAPVLGRGQREVGVADVERWLREQMAVGKTQGAWSDETTRRVARGCSRRCGTSACCRARR